MAMAPTAGAIGVTPAAMVAAAMTGAVAMATMVPMAGAAADSPGFSE
jgi:hypothetical protein